VIAEEEGEGAALEAEGEGDEAKEGGEEEEEGAEEEGGPEGEGGDLGLVTGGVEGGGVGGPELVEAGGFCGGDGVALGDGALELLAEGS
jgi:hypothetical protein